MPNLLHIFYIIKYIIELFTTNVDFTLILSCQANIDIVSFILWGDEIFGRHALLSRG